MFVCGVYAGIWRLAQRIEKTASVRRRVLDEKTCDSLSRCIVFVWKYDYLFIFQYFSPCSDPLSGCSCCLLWYMTYRCTKDLATSLLKEAFILSPRFYWDMQIVLHCSRVYSPSWGHVFQHTILAMFCLPYCCFLRCYDTVQYRSDVVASFSVPWYVMLKICGMIICRHDCRPNVPVQYLTPRPCPHVVDLWNQSLTSIFFFFFFVSVAVMDSCMLSLPFVVSSKCN